jgi:alkanesulfonate monooxygenase SsuD/methylene tetrahydromethanopterin reductase-like flavin-dependent oxidoreductase (luciferase family)
MQHRPFRFGVIGAWARDCDDWAAQARRAEQLGYSSLLVPDTLGTLAPWPAVAVAAAVTSALRVGPYVLATSRRNPEEVAWEAATVQLLSGGRLELGLGAGRPAAAQEVERLGLPPASAAERLDRLRRTVAAVRERSPEVPVLIAGSGPRALALAGELADAVALGVPPDADETALAGAVGRVRDAAEQAHRPDGVELNLNLALVGDDVPPWLAQRVGAAAGALADGSSVATLRGTTEQRCATLRRRRDELGISYVVTSTAFAGDLAPVVDRLSGT